MNKQFAIFDMDGTLVDSMIYWKNLATEFLQSKGVQSIPQEIIEKIKPMTMTESAALFMEQFSLVGTPESIAAEMNALMDEHYRTDIPVKHGVMEYLAALHNKNIQMCVASATAIPLVDACLTRVGIRKYFKFLLSCESVGVGKNRPDVYYEAIRKLGSTPCETAVYEDALYAIHTAKNAGFYVVGVYDESARTHWNEIISLADEIIYDFKEDTK